MLCSFAISDPVALKLCDDVPLAGRAEISSQATTIARLYLHAAQAVGGLGADFFGRSVPGIATAKFTSADRQRSRNDGRGKKGCAVDVASSGEMPQPRQQRVAAKLPAICAISC